MAEWSILRVGGGALLRTGSGLRFFNPSPDARRYINAQLDDTQGRRRSAFPLAAAVDAHGPCAFFASRRRAWRYSGLWLLERSVHDDRAPAAGAAAALSGSSMRRRLLTWRWRRMCRDGAGRPQVSMRSMDGRSPHCHFCSLAAPFMRARAMRRRLWPLFQRQFRVGEALLPVDMTGWHTYTLVWTRAAAVFAVDGQTVLVHTPPPRGPLGLVVWIDNQYYGCSAQWPAASWAGDVAQRRSGWRLAR